MTAITKFRGGLAAISVSAIIGVALTGCSTDQSAGDGSATEITFSYLWAGPEGAVMEELIAEFNKSQDAIIVKGVSNPDTAAQLAAMAGSQGQFDVSDNWCISTAAWEAQGLVASLSPFIERDSYDLTDFIKAPLELNQVDGEYYALPVAVNTYQLLYNKDLLDAAGVTPPTTFDELVTAGQALNRVNNGKVELLGFPPLDLARTTINFGGSWATAAGPSVDDAVVEQAAQVYLDATEGIDRTALRDYIATFGDYWSAENPFYQGKYAMVIDGPWHSQMATKFAPDLNWGVVEVPAPSSGEESVAFADCSTLFIPANSSHQDEAWEFVKFMLEPGQVETVAKTLANLPPRTSVAAEGDFSAMGEQFQVWLNALGVQQTRTFPAGTWSNEFYTAIGTAGGDIANGRASIGEGVAAIEESAQSFK